MASKKNAPQNEDVQVIKKKPRGSNSPVIGMNGYDLEPGDNTMYLQQSLELMNLPTIDLHDVVAVQERINEFFNIMAKYDTKPTVAGMAMALGMDRRRLWAIRNDQPTGGSGYGSALPPEVADCIKKAYMLMENLWENYMQNGKINPVTGIFLGKNNYGYQDTVEHVLTPNRPPESYSEAEIRARYEIPDKTDK